MEELPVLSHSRLDVYRCAVAFLGEAHTISKSLPAGHGDLKDQIRRASLSISLNIAEGAGKVSPGEKRKHYAIARGSAMECAAILDACDVMELTTRDQIRPAYDLLARILGMLTKLIR
jgi:four helix bundle protein